MIALNDFNTLKRGSDIRFRSWRLFYGDCSVILCDCASMSIRSSDLQRITPLLRRIFAVFCSQRCVPRGAPVTCLERPVRWLWWLLFQSSYYDPRVSKAQRCDGSQASLFQLIDRLFMRYNPQMFSWSCDVMGRHRCSGDCSYDMMVDTDAHETVYVMWWFLRMPMRPCDATTRNVNEVVHVL